MTNLKSRAATTKRAIIDGTFKLQSQAQQRRAERLVARTLELDADLVKLRGNLQAIRDRIHRMPVGK